MELVRSISASSSTAAFNSSVSCNRSYNASVDFLSSMSANLPPLTALASSSRWKPWIYAKKSSPDKDRCDFTVDSWNRAFMVCHFETVQATGNYWLLFDIRTNPGIFRFMRLLLDRK
jgi:hypothetical protein